VELTFGDEEPAGKAWREVRTHLCVVCAVKTNADLVWCIRR
jgi:hypothetical protein